MSHFLIPVTHFERNNLLHVVIKWLCRTLQIRNMSKRPTKLSSDNTYLHDVIIRKSEEMIGLF